MKSFIAGKLLKQGGGSPSANAVHQFFVRVDADGEWLPGKGNYEDTGAPSVMTGQQRAAMARSAMNMKSKGIDMAAGYPLGNAVADFPPSKEFEQI